MVSSLQALLAGIIDYAGLFPPAELPLARALQAYARYCHDPDRWMLGRFVCPAGRLEELEPTIAESFSPDNPLRLCVLGRGGQSAVEFLAGLRADVEAILALWHRHRSRTEIGGLEVRVPAEILAAGSPAAAGKLLDEVARTLAQTSLPQITVYYEAPPETAGRASVSVLSTALANDHQPRAGRGRRHNGPAGFKLRCGGLQATDIPSPEEVALTITACRDAGVPLKFTAGLHHPVRRFDPGLQASMHGFLNLFAAGVLAHARQLNRDQLRPIIEDEDPEDFAFADEGLRWKDYRATVAEIQEARRGAVRSFGSCSFEEPRDELRAMGLLP